VKTSVSKNTVKGYKIKQLSFHFTIYIFVICSLLAAHLFIAEYRNLTYCTIGALSHACYTHYVLVQHSRVSVFRGPEVPLQSHGRLFAEGTL
jgi:hypothetical protein